MSGTVNFIKTASEYTFTAFPLKMALVSPSDSTDFATPGFVRVNADGAVTFLPVGNADGDTITLDLLAGDVIPCVVRRVLDTGTDSITMHLSY